MAKLLITRGLQGSGKSYWSREFVQNDPNYVRVCRDDFRLMRGRYWLPKQEKLITKWEKFAVKSALDAGYSVVVDSMNLNPATFEMWKSFAKTEGVQFEVKDFTKIGLEKCLENDLKRPNSLGEKIIRDTYNKYLAPKPEIIVQDESLPKCIIVDCDGTLNKVTNRSPYDGTNCHLDEANEHVVEVVQLLSFKYRVIVMSGLEDKYRSQRESWLDNHGVPVSALYMRKTGDARGDDIIKKELFEEHVKDKFYVHCIIDDRPKMVRAWRRMGFTDRILAVGDQDIDF